MELFSQFIELVFADVIFNIVIHFSQQVEDVALELATQTVRGAARLLLESDESPELLRERVTSPGGTTRAGLDALEAGGFSEVVAGAVRAATRRSAELRQIAEDVAD